MGKSSSLTKQSLTPEITPDEILDIPRERQLRLQGGLFGRFLQCGINPEGKEPFAEFFHAK